MRGAGNEERVPAMEEECEVEESFFVVEFNGLFDPKMIEHKLKSCSFLNVEGYEVILKIGHAFYKGNFERCFGTNVCFQQLQSNDGKQKRLEYIAKTDKKLVVQRVFLEPKNDNNMEVN